jgi:putative nucleotidyltransferase with HDIG domain
MPHARPPGPSYPELFAAAQAAEQAGAWAEALLGYEQALQAAMPSDGPEAPEALRRIGILHRERGDLDLARDALDAGIALAEARGLRAVVARALNDRGGVELREGDMDAAERLYLRTAELAAEVGDERLAAVIEQNLGIVADVRGDADVALARYRRAVDALRRVGDLRSAGMTLNNLAMTLAAVGRLDDAEAAYAEAERLGEAAHSAATLASVQMNRADLALRRRDHARARHFCDAALETCTRMESRWRLATVHRHYGTLFRETGELDRAAEHLAQAVELARASGNRLVEAEAENEHALLHLRHGRNREVLRSLNRAHRLFTGLRAAHRVADVESRLDGMEATYLHVVSEWGDSIESLDHYTAGHCDRVADYACRLAAAVGFGGRDLTWLRMGAFLHDVGKTSVSPEVLNKPGRLTEAEWAEMRRHTLVGDAIVAELDFPWDIRPVVRNHHEHWDGSGYPDGLAGEAIPLTARILCVADCFDALTTARSYRPAMARDDALAEMLRDSGRVFDPRLLELFVRLMTDVSDAAD